MLVIHADTAASAAYIAGQTCLEHGRPRAPRGHATLDLGPTAVVVANSDLCVPEGVGRRGLSPAIGVAEGLFLVAGETDAELLMTLSPFFGELLDSRGEVDGAYGPRARAGIEAAVAKLLLEPDTRQAVALVWNERDPLLGSRDVPCTVSFTFYVDSDEQLCLHAVMRSWDVVLGLSYDLMQFSILQHSVANVLSRASGPLTVTATSLHLYERDVNMVREMHPHDGTPLTSLGGVGVAGEDWQSIRFCASEILHGRLSPAPTRSEEWMRDTLHDRLARARTSGSHSSSKANFKEARVHLSSSMA